MSSQGGIDALLDLLEVAPRVLLSLGLGCLADLLLNPITAPYVKAWKSDRNGRSAAALLLKFWKEEEERLSGASQPP